MGPLRALLPEPDNIVYLRDGSARVSTLGDNILAFPTSLARCECKVPEKGKC